MKYMGHIENGNIVLDEPALLTEGMRVQIEFVTTAPNASAGMPLRGTTYSFEDPFSPAADPDEWGAVQ